MCQVCRIRFRTGEVKVILDYRLFNMVPVIHPHRRCELTWKGYTLLIADPDCKAANSD